MNKDTKNIEKVKKVEKVEKVKKVKKVEKVEKTETEIKAKANVDISPPIVVKRKRGRPKKK